MVILETTNQFSWPANSADAVHRAIKGADGDVKAQGIRLHEHLLSQGYQFPAVSAHGYETNPILNWTGGYSRRITEAALSLDSGMSKQHAINHHGGNILALHDKLIGHLEAAPALPENVHVYSGISTSFGDNLNDLRVRDVYNTQAPLSTSLHPGVAYKRSFGGHLINVLLHGNTSPGLYIGGAEHAFSHNEATPEYELITKPKRRLLFLGTSKSKTPSNNPLTIHNFVDVTGK